MAFYDNSYHIDSFATSVIFHILDHVIVFVHHENISHNYFRNIMSRCWKKYPKFSFHSWIVSSKYVFAHKNTCYNTQEYLLQHTVTTHVTGPLAALARATLSSVCNRYKWLLRAGRVFSARILRQDRRTELVLHILEDKSLQKTPW